MSIPRDSQRQKLYRAEREIAGRKIGDCSVQACEVFVARVWRWVVKSGLSTGPTPDVRDGRGRRHAGGCDAYVTLPRWARTYTVVLHELAHTVCWRNYGWSGVASHGREFAAVLIKLIRRWHPDRNEAARALRESFKKHKVRHTLR